MKKLPLIIFTTLLLSSISSFAQVGINTDNPTETLDVNGKAKFRDVPNSAPESDYHVLVTDGTNVIKKIAKADLEIKKETVKVTIPAGSSANIPNTLEYDVLNIIITASNTCSRTMISTFSSNQSALAFLNGLARDIIADTDVVLIPNTAAPKTSAGYIVTFPGITNCTGSTVRQFNFTFEKTDHYDYLITNNGDGDLEYTITFQKIY